MMRSIIQYYDLSKKAILETSGENKITFGLIENQTYTQLNELSKLKFIDPKIERADMQKKTNVLIEEITTNIRKLTDK